MQMAGFIILSTELAWQIVTLWIIAKGSARINDQLLTNNQSTSG